jgi:hypothetical protein
MPSEDDYFTDRIRKLASVRRMHHERATESIYQLERGLPGNDPLRAAFYRLRTELAARYAELIARDNRPTQTP